MSFLSFQCAAIKLSQQWNTDICDPAWNQTETCVYFNVWYRRNRGFGQNLCKNYQNKLDISFLNNLKLGQTQADMVDHVQNVSFWVCKSETLHITQN